MEMDVLHVGARALAPWALILLVALPGAALLRRRLAARLRRSTAAGGAGVWGLAQPLADAVKLLGKTGPAPPLSAVQAVGLSVALLVPLALLAAVPYSRVNAVAGSRAVLQLGDVGVGYVLALIGLGAVAPAALAAAAGTWVERAAGLRVTGTVGVAVVVIGLCLVGVAAGASSPRLADIVAGQVNRTGLVPRWNLLWQPVGFACAVGALLAWAQLAPLAVDGGAVATCGGHAQTQGGPVLCWLRVAAHLRALAAAVLLTTLFLGGAHLPWDVLPPGHGRVRTAVELATFGAKTATLLAAFTWLGDVMPQLRTDRVRFLLWRRLIPLAAANLVWVVLYTAWRGQHG